jgi:hypothetical protein
MVKIANPLNYPVAVLAAGIVLFVGVRLARLSSIIMLPVAAAIATAGASFLQAKEGEEIQLKNPALEREIQTAKQQANLLLEKSENLRLEAEKLLTSSFQVELLTAVQYACDRTLELPAKIDQLAERLHGSDSLLSVAELEKQLAQVRKKQSKSSGIARQQLQQLEASLQRNINLARQGQDARQAQVFSLVNLITESAGVLQQLQNRLRTSDLNNSEQINELRGLSDELSNLQANVDLFMESN